MKIDLPPINVQRDGVIGERKKFGISEKNMSHLLGILRSKLYSNKALAVVREYCCNAWDSHLMNGDQRPIEITLPGALDPVFRVRDHGLGMSPEIVEQTYIMYGDSTSRDNDRAIGGMGIGSKAGFAYGDSFIVTSWNGGRKRTYSCVIDESRRGELACIDDVECQADEHGVEISVPVLPSDFEKFQKCALDVLKHFEPRPLINGTPYISDTARLFGDERGKWFVSRKDDRYNSRPNIILGNIEYVIDSDLVDGLKELQRKQGIDFGRMVLIALPGDVDIAASRESLEYTERTKKWILSSLEAITDDALVAECKRAIRKDASITTYVQALKEVDACLRTVMSGDRWASNSKKVDLIKVFRDLSWNGQMVIHNGLPLSPLAFRVMYHMNNRGKDTDSEDLALPVIEEDKHDKMEKWATGMLHNLSNTYFSSSENLEKLGKELTLGESWGGAIVYSSSSSGNRGRDMQLKDFMSFSMCDPEEPTDPITGRNNRSIAVYWTNKVRSEKGISPAYTKYILSKNPNGKSSFAVVQLPKGVTPDGLNLLFPGCTTHWQNLEEAMPFTQVGNGQSLNTIDNISKLFTIPSNAGWRPSIKDELKPVLVKTHFGSAKTKYYVKYDRGNNCFPITHNGGIVNLDFDNVIRFCNELSALCRFYDDNQIQDLDDSLWRDAWGMDEDNFAGLPLENGSIVAVNSKKSETMMVEAGYVKIDTVFEKLLPHLATLSGAGRHQSVPALYMDNTPVNLPRELVTKVRKAPYFDSLPREVRWLLKVALIKAKAPKAKKDSTASRYDRSRNGNVESSSITITAILDRMHVSTGAVNSKYWRQRNKRGNKMLAKLHETHPSITLLVGALQNSVRQAAYRSGSSSYGNRSWREGDGDDDCVDNYGMFDKGMPEEFAKELSGISSTFERELEWLANSNKKQQPTQ
jgi:hypothetical protein